MTSDDTNLPALKPIDDVGRHRVPTGAELAIAARREFNANDFLAIVSHDLRAPLRAMIAIAGLIRENAGREDAAASTQAWVDELLESVAIMDRLIQDLECENLDDGELRISRTRLELGALVEHVTDVFAPLAAAKSIVLSRDIARPLPVNGDGSRLLQVLCNLVDNAIQFTPAGGCVRVCAARAGRDHVVSVVDTGVGIPKDALRTIFAARRTRGPSDPPTWRLGLYCSRRIVEAHDGRIWAEGQVGVGSTFYFTLPAARTKRRGHEPVVLREELRRD
jgi:chemotaxis family two-component system sensor kinase Cph1